MKWMARVKLKRRRRADLDPAEPAGLPSVPTPAPTPPVRGTSQRPLKPSRRDKEVSTSQDRGIANWSPAPQVCCIDGVDRVCPVTVREARVNQKKVRVWCMSEESTQCRQRRHYHLDNAHRSKNAPTRFPHRFSCNASPVRMAEHCPRHSSAQSSPHRFARV